MAACMSSLGALGAWTPENKAALVEQMGTNCGTMVGPGPDRDHISTWDTSKIREMDRLFNSCYNFNEDISKWDVSKVYTFNRMFLQAGKFNVDISSWNTESAETFQYMFYRAEAFNQPLNMWNTSTATNFKYMFFRATAFKQPLDSWNTEKATNFEGMFYWAHNFNQPLGSWNTEKATTFFDMFTVAERFNQPLNMWNTSKATNFRDMFNRATAFNQPLGSWNTEKATTFFHMFYSATAFNQPLGSWNTGKVTDFNNIFGGTSVPIDTTAYWDTTNSRSGRYLFPQQPCPAGYNASQSYRNGGGGLRIGTLAVRCPDGCNVAGYYQDANGFCRDDCSVSQCLVCKNVNECGQCNPGYQFDAQCTACPNPGIGEKLTTTAGACTVTPCPVVGVYYYGDYYYTTAGDCTKIQNCPSLGDNEEYVTGVVLTSPTGCKKCSSPGIGQKFISPSPSPGACTVTPCPVVAGEYYIEGTEECTTTSCTNRDTSTQYYDKQEVIIEDDCSVATCPTGKTPAANGLSCVDELKEKEKEAASDSNSPMVGAIVGSVVGVLVLVAVAGILVWVFVIRPRRL